MTCLTNPWDQPESVRLTKLKTLRNELQAARLLGHRRVRDSDGSEIEFKSDSEMAAAIAAADAEIAAYINPQPKTIYLRTSKGL